MEGSSSSPCRKLLPLACRFIQRDQWLIAHLDPQWKVKDVKRYLLAKCVGLPFIPPILPAKSAALDGTDNGGEGGRPSSPITFAPDPRFRPISPIQFASTSLPKGSVEAKSITEPGGDDGGEGYEEDDEWDDDDDDLFDDEGSHEGGGGLVKLGSSTTAIGTSIPSANPRRFGHVKSSGSISSLGVLDRERRGASSASPNKPPSPLGLNSTTHENYTLLRFTTGQILEDDFHISWYELAPHELLELHASGAAQTSFKTCFENALILSPPPTSFKSHQQSQTRILIPMPRHVSLKYIQPYWEGWVRALRVVYKDEFDYVSGAYHSKHGTSSASMLGSMAVAGTVEIGSVTGERNHKEIGDVRKRRKTRLEWRERWVVIRDGIVSLSRDRQDPTPTHRMPLSSLTQLRGAEHLARSARTNPSSKSHGHPHSKHMRPSSAVNADREGRKEGLRPHDKPAKWDDLARKNGESSSKPFSFAPSPPSSPREDARFHRHGNSIAHGHGDPWSRFPAEASSSFPGESYVLRVRGGPDKRFDRSYIPFSHEEAESAGMRVVCARFRTIKGSSKVSQEPAPRKEKGTEGKQYTSTGPSLAMLAGGVGGSTGGGPGVAMVAIATVGLGGEKGGSVQPGRKDVRDREKEKQREKRREAEKVKAKSKHKEHELGLFDELRGQYARKSSLPALGLGFMSSPAASTANFNAGSSAHPTGKSGLVSGFFGSPKEKKDKGKARKEDDEVGLSWQPSKTEREEQEREGRDQSFSRGTGTGQTWKPSDRGQGLSTDFTTSVVEPAHSDGGNSDVVEEDTVLDVTQHQPQYDVSRLEANLEEEDRGMGSSQASSDDEPAGDSENNYLSPLNRGTSLPPITIPGSEVLSGSLEPDAHGGLDTAESSALSSPVFAHSTCSGSESDLSLGLGRAGKDRPSYRYGYRHDRVGKVDLHGEERGEKSGPLPNPTEREGEGGDQLQPKEEPFDRAKPDKGKERDRAHNYERRKDDEHGEWIILDLGNEQAYTSILRIFHRHLSVPSSSSFTPSVPVIPFERPTSPGRPLGGHPPFWSSTTLASQKEVDEEISPTTRKRATSDAGLASGSHRAFGQESDADDDGDYFASSPFRITKSKSRHPTILASLGVGNTTNRRGPFEPLPYPEWRLEVVERAQAAGMGERGRPLDLILFGNRPSFQMDESKRQKSLKSYDSRSRRSTVTTLSMRRPSHVNDGETIRSDSDKKEGSVNDGSDDIIQVSDSEEEMSEVEWRGWMGDLHRQNVVRAQRDETAILEAQVSSKARESDDSDDPPINPEAERRKFWRRKKDMEPCGVITSLYTSTALPGFVATSHEHHQQLHHQQHLRRQRSSRPATTTTLSSPSSNESLAVHRRGALSFGFSPVDISSASTSPPSSLSHHGHSHSQSQTFLGHHRYTGHSSLHHSTSMYAGLRNDPRLVQEPPPRRPSMPTLTAEQNVGLLTSSEPLRMPGGKREQGFVITERTTALATSETTSPFQFNSVTIQTPHLAMVPSSPTASSSNIPVLVSGEQEDIPPSSSSTPATTPRRVSSAGLAGPLAGGSISRSTSVLSKGGGLLRKKESDLGKDADRARKAKEKQDKAREKEERAKEKERAKEMEKEHKARQDASGRKLQRPKLSLATSSSRQNLTSSEAHSPQVRSPTMAAAKQILRRVKSGSSLKSVNEAASPVVGPSISSSKKKKPGALERIVRGLDSALDFSSDSRK